jgi:predicted amidophosphoribosyltransferase
MMNNPNLCARCQSDYAVHPATLCWRCREELDDINYDIQSYTDLMDEPSIDPDDTADIQLLFDDEDTDDDD